jgi:hypothetical protein
MWLAVVGPPTSRIQCVYGSGNTCDLDGISNAVANADYSSCNGAVSGTTCSPQCADGYAVSSAATGFTLRCDSNGDFDGADGTLSCSGV